MADYRKKNAKNDALKHFYFGKELCNHAVKDGGRHRKENMNNVTSPVNCLLGIMIDKAAPVYAQVFKYLYRRAILSGVRGGSMSSVPNLTKADMIPVIIPIKNAAKNFLSVRDVVSNKFAGMSFLLHKIFLNLLRSLFIQYICIVYGIF